MSENELTVEQIEQAELPREMQNSVVTQVVSNPKLPVESTNSEMGMVKMSDSPQNIAAQFERYEQLRSLILKEEDFYPIKTDGKVVGHGTGKSGLYKLGVAFNLSTYVVEEKKITKPSDPQYLAYQMTVQCTAPNGRNVMEVGFCDNTRKDKFGESEHVVRAMAKTRATERAYTVMTGETGKKPSPSSLSPDKKAAKPTVICKCVHSKTGVDGICKTCGAVNKTYYENHPDEF